MRDKCLSTHVEILMTPTSLEAVPVIMNVEIRTVGVSQPEAQDATVLAMALIATGRKTFVRVAPESDTYVDFATKIAHYRGYARFSVVDEPGEWQDSKHVVTRIPSLGEA